MWGRTLRKERPMRRHTSNVPVLVLLVASVLQVACTSPLVMGKIPPSTFQFHEVVPRTGASRSGWKVAQVIILLGRISPVFPQAATCDVEVGVPSVSRQGQITNSIAQQAAARSADEAARLIFAEGQPTALMCQDFRVKMGALMIDEQRVPFVAGARVSRFNPWNIEITPRTFP
jgi:hypothetical protein